MYSSATIDIPRTGHIGPSRHILLSDDLAVSFGRRAARTLSGEDGCVKVTLKSGKAVLIGHDDLTGKLTERDVL